MTFVAFPRPFGVTEPAIQLLYQRGQEEQTGVVGTSLTLENAPIPGTLLLFKDGVLLREAAGAGNYTINGLAVTLGTAALAGDIYFAHYHWRGTREG